MHCARESRTVHKPAMHTLVTVFCPCANAPKRRSAHRCTAPLLRGPAWLQRRAFDTNTNAITRRSSILAPSHPNICQPMHPCEAGAGGGAAEGRTAPVAWINRGQGMEGARDGSQRRQSSMSPTCSPACWCQRAAVRYCSRLYQMTPGPWMAKTYCSKTRHTAGMCKAGSTGYRQHVARVPRGHRASAIHLEGFYPRSQ